MIISWTLSQHQIGEFIMDFIQGSTLYRCLIELPNGFMEGEKLPLVVGLHGGGSGPAQLINLWAKVPEKRFIFAVPQAPHPLLDSSEPVSDWGMWPSQKADLIQKATLLSEQYILNVVSELSQSYSSERVYLLGFSQGAIFTYLVGIKHSHLFEGLICMSGPGLLQPLKNPFASKLKGNWLDEDNIQQASKLRVFITHGINDPAANHALGVHSKDVLERYRYEVRFRDFDGGHQYPPREILQEVSAWVCYST